MKFINQTYDGMKNKQINYNFCLLSIITTTLLKVHNQLSATYRLFLQFYYRSSPINLKKFSKITQIVKNIYSPKNKIRYTINALIPNLQKRNYFISIDKI